jgi:AmmeMemoRadiSam system protein B
MSRRVDAHSGTFYPTNQNEIVSLIDKFNEILESHPEKLSKLKTKILISPHAGYIYSGFSANCGFASIKDDNFKRVVVIGPSHRVAFDGVSIANFDKYSTPFGDIDIDRELLENLQNRFNLISQNEAHFEHSTETQMPFLKYYLKDKFKVTELVYQNIDIENLEKIIEYLSTLEDTLIVISTDLSHFHTLDRAKYIDSYCVNGVKELNFEYLQKCEACGILGLVAALIYAKKSTLKTQILDYRTSADSSGDSSRVVGYLSAVIGE